MEPKEVNGVRRYALDSRGAQYRPVVGSCEVDNESLGSIKSGKVLDRLNDS
jgi:hypothetical protein